MLAGGQDSKPITSFCLPAQNTSVPAPFSLHVTELFCQHFRHGTDRCGRRPSKKEFLRPFREKLLSGAERSFQEQWMRPRAAVTS